MVQGRVRPAMTRSDSAENKLDETACNTSGWTRVVLTNQTVPSSPKLSTPCFAGMRMQLVATFIYRMFGQGSGKQTIGSLSIPGNQLFGQVDGLLGVGPLKSSLPHVSSSFSLKKASG